MLDATAPHALPAVAGIGYKSQHFSGLMAAPGPVGWLEIHAENYMGAGGRPLAQLRALAERFPISVHGVAYRSAASARLIPTTSHGFATCATG